MISQTCSHEWTVQVETGSTEHIMSTSTLTQEATQQAATLHLTGGTSLQEDAGSFDFSEKTVERTSEEERQYRKETLAAGFRLVIYAKLVTDFEGSLPNMRSV